MHIKSFTKNLMPWRDSNPGLLVPEAGAMSTAPRRRGLVLLILIFTLRKIFSKKLFQKMVSKNGFSKWLESLPV
jgi:hypothetical protein